MRRVWRCLAMNPMLLVCINFVPSKIIFQANVLNDAQGQGCKICPFSDADNAHTPHTHATRDALKQRLKESQYQMRTVGTCSAQWALFEKTLSLYRSYHVNGCMGPASPTETVTTDLHSAMTRVLKILPIHMVYCHATSCQYAQKYWFIFICI